MSTAKARRWWRPQFSLRTLLLLVTALGLVIPGGIGWWRRPFEVVERSAQSNWQHQALLEWESMPEKQRATFFRKRLPLSPLPIQPYKHVTHVYREVTGELVRHGMLVTYDHKDRKLREEVWHHGQLHGRWADWHPDGSLIAYGEYRHGKPHGSWVELKQFDRQGRPKPGTRTTEYRDGAAYSVTTQQDNDLRTTRFSAGLPTREQVWDATSLRLVDDVPYSSVLLFLGGEHVSQPVPHGLARSWHRNGQPQEEVTFDKGRHVGTARGWYADGARCYEGAFEAGLEHGRWTWWNADGTVLRTAELRHGRIAEPEGAALPPLPLPEVGGQSPRCVVKLDRPTGGFIFNQVPLRDAVLNVSELHGVRIAIDRRALAAVPLDTALSYSSPTRINDLRGRLLRSELQFLLRPIGLVPVVRFESLVLTTPDEARTWRDGTGTIGIADSQTSAFAAELRRPTSCEFNETPLREVIQYFAALHNLPIRLAPDAAEELQDLPCTVAARDVSLAVGLGSLLDQHDLCCQDTGSELLVRRAADGAAEGAREPATRKTK